MAEPQAYPKELERWVRLKDGALVRIRPIRPGDARGLIALYDRLSQYTAYQRFFTVMKRLPPDWAEFFASVDYGRRLALIAERDTAGRPELIGVGRYEAVNEDTAEVAFVLQDAWQGKELGVILLNDLLPEAEARGFRRFQACVFADNTRMLGLLGRHTEILKKETEESVVSLLFRRRLGPASSIG